MLLNLLFASLAYASCSRTWAANTTVGAAANTSSGLLIGHPNHRYPYVSEYLGIPFAQPPIADLRFMPPQPYSSNSARNATAQPPSCPQPPAKANYSNPEDIVNIFLYDGTYANHTNEDCLYLNVWTKYPFQNAPLKPVIVWIYGGGFHLGGISDGSQQGAIFAEEQDVVFVSMNYRLALLGFPGAPNTRQNLGLLDQRLALEWVRNNIAAFGGDPDKITIMGHSAGGASVDYYSYAWTSDPIIAGSIPMSGNVFAFGNRAPSTAALSWYAASSLLGCGNKTTTSDNDILGCMKSKSAADLVAIAPKVESAVAPIIGSVGAGYEGVTGPFGPTIDNQTVFENYTIRGQQQDFIHAPLMTGTSDDEGCLFAETGLVPVKDEDVLTTAVFTCPTYLTAKNRLEAGVPTWKYRWFGAYPNTYNSACPGRPWHGSELYVIFGSSRQASKVNTTHDEVEAGWYWRNAITTFARDASLTSIGWPKESKDQSNVVVLGLNSTLVTVQDAGVWNKPCLTTYTSGAPDF